MINKVKYIITAFVAFAIVSCNDFETDLNVVNEQNPKSTGLGIDATANKLFQNWYVAINNYNGPGLAFATMADVNTCSWGNAGMLDTSSEPRIKWDNRAEYGNSNITYDYFNSLNAVLTDANSIVISANANPEAFDDVNRTKAIGKFGQAAAIGYLALVFDKVWVYDETGTLNNGEPVSYKEAMKIALTKLDEAIVLSNQNNFTITKDFTNTKELTNTEFSAFLNALGARLMVNNVRNVAQRDALDWAKVKTYAENGLNNDFLVTGDGWEQWYNDKAMYSIYPGWGRVDMRVMALMDSTFPSYWNATVAADAVANGNPQVTTSDKRLESDFEYLDSNNFREDRGIYHYSSYRHSRYDWFLNDGFIGDYPEYLKAENDLYLAEAQLRTGDVAGAAATINASSRVLRGKLPNVPADATAVEDAIHYERSIELLSTSLGLGFFEMRRNDLLQPGTILHFPVPGAALNAAKEPNYTFGGSTGVAGEDYSDGGWR